MPLVYQQNINEATKLAVWHITEAEEFFLKRIMLPASITHPHKRLQHLAGRYLLTELFEHFPLQLIEIADTKKPFLPGEAFHFSISHCGEYAAAIASKSNRVGVDIEVISEKIARIKDKFLSAKEQQMFDGLAAAFSIEQSKQTAAAQLELYALGWSIKETMFKWYGAGGIDFREHLLIEKLTIHDNEYLAQCIFQKNEPIPVNPHGLIFNNNSLTWLVT